MFCLIFAMCNPVLICSQKPLSAHLSLKDCPQGQRRSYCIQHSWMHAVLSFPDLWPLPSLSKPRQPGRNASRPEMIANEFLQIVRRGLVTISISHQQFAGSARPVLRRIESETSAHHAQNLAPVPPIRPIPTYSLVLPSFQSGLSLLSQFLLLRRHDAAFDLHAFRQREERSLWKFGARNFCKNL